MNILITQLLVPWLGMLPFVLVAIAAIEMIKDWMPSRLTYVGEEWPEVDQDEERRRLGWTVIDPAMFITPYP